MSTQSNVKKVTPATVPSTIVLNKEKNNFLIPSAEGTGFNGIHGMNSWLDKGARLFAETGLEIEVMPDNIVSIQYMDKTYLVKLEVLLTAALYEPIRMGQVEQFLELWQKGYNTLSQLNFSGKTLEPDLLESLPGLKELGFTEAGKTKGSKMINLTKVDLTSSDIDVVKTLGYTVHSVIYDTSDLIAPKATGIKITVPDAE